MREAKALPQNVSTTSPDSVRLAPALSSETSGMRKAIGREPLVNVDPVTIDAKNLKSQSDLMKVLSSIVDARAKGRRVAMVFDIDNTLMDTRHRTAAAASSFKYRDTSPMQGVTFEHVGYRPEDTCRANNIADDATISAFANHFNEFFWKPENLLLDQPLAGPIALAQLAKSLGAELYFLTGRTTTFRDQTIAQLEKAGIGPESAGHLIMKSPKRDGSGRLEPTEKFKARELRKIYRQKVRIAGFVTEGSRDMCWLQKHVPEVRRYLFLQFPIDEPGYQVDANRTVFLPLELRLPTRDEVLQRGSMPKP